MITNGTTICVEKIYSTNFTVTNEKFCLSLHYNGDSSYLFVSGKEVANFKAKDSETVPYPLCLGNVSKDFSLINTTNTGLFGFIYDFIVDYKAITNDKIHDIQCKMIFGFIKKCFFTAMTFFDFNLFFDFNQMQIL